jgi:hypothetical protein
VPHTPPGDQSQPWHPSMGYQDQKDFAQEGVDVILLAHGVDVIGDGLKMGLARVIWAM